MNPCYIRFQGKHINPETQPKTQHSPEYMFAKHGALSTISKLEQEEVTEGISTATKCSVQHLVIAADS